MTPANVVTVGPHPVKLILRLAFGVLMGTVGVAGVVVGLSLVLFGRDWLFTYGLVIAAVGGGLMASLGVVSFLAAIFGQRPRVEIGPEGFVFVNLFGRRERRWLDVEGDFVVIRIGWYDAVGYRLTPEFKESSGIKSKASLSGNDEAMMGTYRMTTRELAALLTQRKEQVIDLPRTSVPSSNIRVERE